MLLAKVVAAARSLRLSQLTMHSSLTAAAFYIKHGYKSLGEEAHTLRGENEGDNNGKSPEVSLPNRILH